MKILHLDFDDLKNPLGGGQAVRTFEINRRLAKKHQVMVVTGNYPGAKNEIIEEISYLRIGQKKFPWNFLSFFWHVPEIVKKNNFDLLVENFTPPFGPVWSPRFTQKPVIAMVDWAFAWEMSSKYKLPFFIPYEIGLRLYKNFIFPTQAIQKNVLRDRQTGLKILTLNNQTLSEFPRSIKNIQTKNYILFIGRLDIHQKGLDLLIKAYSKIPNKAKMPLLVAGEGKDKEKIEKLIKVLNLEKYVKLIGQIVSKEKIRYLQEARIVVVPSRYESGCIVANECLLLKKAMVTFDNSALVEQSQKQAVFAKSFDIEDLAKKIIYAWENASEISKKMIYKPLPSWDEAAKIQEDFYLKVIGQETAVR